MTSFLGLDLAWHSTGKFTALAHLSGDADEVVLQAVAPALLTDDEILVAITDCTATDTVLAIDAPLVIRNATGQRPCETLLSRRFGHAHAGPHTCNLSLFPAARSVAIATRLESLGWGHNVDPLLDRNRPGRWFFEVYPHPAHVVLFDLPRIIKYKKGTLAQKRAGLNCFRMAIALHFGRAQPRLVITSPLALLFQQDLALLAGSALKSYEDMLDAIVCAYTAAHYWAWGSQRNEIVGTMTSGYFVIPSRTSTGVPWTHARTHAT